MKQNWTEVKKQLKYCSERDLMRIIQDLYKLNKNNKDYLNLRYLAGNSDEQKNKLLKSAVDHIESGWEKSYWDPYGYSGTPSRVKVSEIKKPINNYKKAIGSDERRAQLFLKPDVI